MNIRRVLACGLNVMKNMAVVGACQRIGAEFCLIKPEDYHKSLGNLSKVVGFENKAPEYDISDEPGEFLFFAGFEGNDFDKFLEEYRKPGVGAVLYKAMLTEYNVLWSPAFLYSEMVKERKEIESKK